MAISQVQKASVDPNTATSSTATFGSTPTNGNLLVAVFRAASTLANITLPSGWSTAVSEERAGPLTIVIAYKVASSDGTGVTFSTSGSVDQELATAEYSGTATSSPLDVTGSAESASTATSQTSGTTGVSSETDKVVIAAIGLGGGSGGFANTWTNSFTQQAEQGRTSWAHRIVSSTGVSYETTEAWTTSRTAVGAIAAFKAAAAPAGGGFVDRGIPRGVLRGVRPN